MDILYIYHKSPNNDLELMYSLRSLSHIRDLGRVFVCGYLPRFVKNVIYIPCDDIGYPAINHWWKVTQAIKNSDIGENFVLMYDDIFFLKDTTLGTFPNYHRGILGEVKVGTPLYQETLCKTKKWLLKHELPILDYSLHLPFTYNRGNFLMLEEIFKPLIREQSPLAPRSIYGNMFVNDSPLRDDFKMRNISDSIPDRECFSVSDSCFPQNLLDTLYPLKGDFE